VLVGAAPQGLGREAAQHAARGRTAAVRREQCRSRARGVGFGRHDGRGLRRGCAGLGRGRAGLGRVSLATFVAARWELQRRPILELTLRLQLLRKPEICLYGNGSMQFKAV
jgi:hypothetical protein